MARRKELKNIAAGIYGSFISRNNDVAGYWGIGKLCLHAQMHNVTVVSINILEQKMIPQNSEFEKLLKGYNKKLKQYLYAKNISEAWVSLVEIKLNFNPEPPGKNIPIKNICGDSLFELYVSITDDKGKKRSISGFGYCIPHNKKYESKSLDEDRIFYTLD